MKCKNCGTEFNSAYCPGCGTKGETGDEYEYGYGYDPGTVSSKKTGTGKKTDLAMIGLILGIVAVVLSITMSGLVYLLGIAALVLGIISLGSSPKKGKSVFAIILGVAAVVIVVLARVFVVKFVYNGIMNGIENDSRPGYYENYDGYDDFFGMLPGFDLDDLPMFDGGSVPNISGNT